VIQKTDTSKTLFLFENEKEIRLWNTVDDNVMGGLSKGKVSYAQDSCLDFSGFISLDNNGGFSSIRAIPDNYRLGDYEGIRIKLKGDGRTYQFRVRTDRNFDGVAFKQEFNTTANKWIEIKLPFSKFLPTYRGRILENEKPLDPDEIKQLGFLIGDKTEGPFTLIVDKIEVYR
jgi:monofunctional biosynthetic peptidoglycan transglycosylase